MTDIFRSFQSLETNAERRAFLAAIAPLVSTLRIHIPNLIAAYPDTE